MLIHILLYIKSNAILITIWSLETLSKSTVTIMIKHFKLDGNSAERENSNLSVFFPITKTLWKRILKPTGSWNKDCSLIIAAMKVASIKGHWPLQKEITSVNILLHQVSMALSLKEVEVSSMHKWIATFLSHIMHHEMYPECCYLIIRGVFKSQYSKLKERKFYILS